MYLEELVEVAIGLIFAWLLISIATMQVQEIIARSLKKRAMDLERAIGNMLKDSEKLAEFYEHPLIKSLSEPLKEKQVATEKRIQEKKDKGEKLSWRDKFAEFRASNKPSYIPAANFSAALFDIVVKAGTEASPIKSVLNGLNNKIETLGEGDKETAKIALEQIYELGKMAANSPAGTEFQQGLKRELKNQVKALGKKYSELAPFTGEIDKAVDNAQFDLKALFTSDQMIEQVNMGIMALFKKDSKSELGKSLRSLMAGINEYASKADTALSVGRKNVETWFDNTMDRLTGWYKRWAQVWAFGIALVVAIAFNVDTINIANELWRNPALRDASTTYIQNFVNSKTENGGELTDTDLQLVNKEIQKLDFPVGWDKISKDANNSEWWFWPLKAIGWLLTAGAAMQGAPFWFDMLKKLINVRSTGTNPNEKPKKEATGTA